ncbi:MAG: caspase family protein [Candidatus Obscuribacterales bacterium]|nr:caspase family protein [Candidatus Obscuribacterales bacterium]
MKPFSSRSIFKKALLKAALAVIAGLAFQSLSLQTVAQEETKAEAPDESSLQSVQNPNRPIKDKWALVIGISKYKESEYNLHFPAKDATDFASTLIEDLNFQPDHVKLLIDEQATRKNILSLLGDLWLPRVARPDDLVLIYISSHGSPSEIDIGKINYIVAHDTDVKSLYATGIPMQDLVRIIKNRVKSNRILIILDSCHSGAASPDANSKGLFRSEGLDVAALSQGTGQLVISSSMPGERSWESRRYKGSVFTKHLIDGLKSFGDETRLNEVFRYTRQKVKDEVESDRGVSQTPVLTSQWKGDELILAAIPKEPAPGLNISIGEVKVLVMPADKSETEKIDQTEQTEAVKTGSETEKALEVEKPQEKTVETEEQIKSLPPRFRFRIKTVNNVLGTKATYSGIYEWNKDKLQYSVKWDDGRKGIGHLEGLENNQVKLSDKTKTFWGPALNKYEGKVEGSRITGTMTGHDPWTNWKGSFEAWWQPE